MRSWYLFAVLCAAVIHSPAASEAVFLTHGGGIGVGWLFLDVDGACRLVTPRHVVSGPDDELVAPDMIERTGRRTTTRRPVAAADPNFDLAFLEAAPLVASDGCSTSRLSGVPLDTVVRRMEQGTLLIATAVDYQRLAVAPVVSSRDEYGGGIIAFEALAGEENFKEGMSGGIILFGGRPVAMLYHVLEETIGLAYRFDAIAAAKNAALGAMASSPDQAAEARILDISVATGDVKSGAVLSLVTGEDAVELLAERGRIVVTVQFGQASVVTGISISSPDYVQLNLRQLVVEAGVTDRPVTYVRGCEIAEGVAESRCAIAARHASRLRLTLVVRDVASPIVIRQLGVQTK